MKIKRFSSAYCFDAILRTGNALNETSCTESGNAWVEYELPATQYFEKYMLEIAPNMKLTSNDGVSWQLAFVLFSAWVSRGCMFFLNTKNFYLGNRIFFYDKRDQIFRKSCLLHGNFPLSCSSYICGSWWNT